MHPICQAHRRFTDIHARTHHSTRQSSTAALTLFPCGTSRRFLFVTGQLAEDPVTGQINRGPIPDQTKQVMENLKLVLDHANASFDNTVMARLVLTDFRDFQAVNEVFSSYFKDGRRPGRTTIGVIALAGQGDVEVDMIVYCGN